MPDVIKLLPDSVANQIAAGEVIQRPASVVKELLENAIDSGAQNIKVVVKDAGKTLIQVVDNGSGMSHTDARLAFDRHATSKITSADDLFKINTKGFRGEALASIAAIAHVSLKTKREEDEMGSELFIEGSEIKSQEFCACSTGSNFTVKHLFYNVPARRNFLKSDGVEHKHVLEEIYRVAMAHPDIAFEVICNGEEIHNMSGNNFRQRIVQLFGKNYNQKLVPVDETTDIVKLSGFIGKPEFSKKTRGEQYLFVNDRFFRSPYFHHAIMNAYEELLPDGQFPSYWLKLDVDTDKIDINIHPTKTEIKFEDERSIYAIIRTSIKQAIGKHNIAPMLDFEQETSFQPPLGGSKMPTEPKIKVNPSFNPFDESSKKGAAPSTVQKEVGLQDFARSQEFEKEEEQLEIASTELQEGYKIEIISQIDRNYILAKVNEQVIVVDQSRAHQQVLYNKLVQNSDKDMVSQQLAFPETVKVSPSDFEVGKEMLPTMHKAGLDVHEFGKNTFVVNGIPAGLEGINCAELMEEIIEQANSGIDKSVLNDLNQVFQWMARRSSIPHGMALGNEEMNKLLTDLFASENPQALPSGKTIFVVFGSDQADELFSV